MNNIQHPRAFMAIGVLLIIIGTILPFLMMLKHIPSTFFLNFFSFTLQIIGLIMGLIGVAIIGVSRYHRSHFEQQDEEEYR
ncbi:MAG: hypothetical protein OHK0052_05820 [Anaerolineales bacterium]